MIRSTVQSHRATARVSIPYTLLQCLLQLQRKGVAVPEDGITISDPELLMDVMEQREAVEETDDVDVLQDMLTANKKLESTTVQVCFAMSAVVLQCTTSCCT